MSVNREFIYLACAFVCRGVNPPRLRSRCRVAPCALFVLVIAAALVALQGYWRTAGFLAATAFSFNAIKVSMNFALTVAVRVHAALGVRSPYTG